MQLLKRGKRKQSGSVLCVVCAIRARERGREWGTDRAREEVKERNMERLKIHLEV